jgi:hypothetical protein
MNFATNRRIAQAFAWVALTAVTVSCGSHVSPRGPAPTAPDATVVAFLSAVRDNDLQDMAGLWGTSRGLAADQMDSKALEQRLTVTRIYLEHEEYAIVERPTDAVARAANDDEQIIWVRLTRRGCTPVVPFTLVRFGNQWLIRNIDLEAAGNPERRCSGNGAS